MVMETYVPIQTLTDSSICRRRILGLTARSAALAGAALATGQHGIAHAQEDQSLVGSWLVAGTPTGAQPGPPRLLVSFVTGGVALRTAPLQQPAPSALGIDKMFISTTHGAWARTAENTFNLTFVGFAFNDAGEFLAMQRIRVAVQLNDNQDGFSGLAKTDFIGADGQVVASSTGSVQGMRIQVEPPA
jgi:hypothetical protein